MPDLGVAVTELSAPRSREALDIINQALAGTLPRSRELKQGEPLQLSPLHMNMILDRALGMKPGEIAEKYDLELPRVSVVLHSPDAEVVLAAVIGKVADRLTDPIERFKATSGEAATTLIHLMRTSANERIQKESAMEILDRSGYGKTIKTEEKHTHEVVMPAHLAERLISARQAGAQAAQMDFRRYLISVGDPHGGVDAVEVHPVKELDTPEQCVGASPDGSQQVAEEKVA